MIDPVGPLSAREAYRAHFRELDPWPRTSTRAGRARIDTLERLIGGSELRSDPYYNEFVVPYGLRDYVGVQVGIGPHAHAHLGMFNSGRSAGAEHVGEVVRRLHMVAAALGAGLRAWLLAENAAGAPDRVLDAIRDAVVVYDGRGRLVHANLALREMLARDSAAGVVREALWAAARELVQGGRTAASDRPDGVWRREVTTLRGTYRISAVHAGTRLCPNGGAMLIVDGTFWSDRKASGALARLGFDSAETDVAVMLADGHEHAGIARRLGISTTAARRLAVEVLRKAGVRSRGQLHALLYP